MERILANWVNLLIKANFESKRSQTYTYYLHNDGRPIHTNWNEFYSSPIRKYTQVDVAGCSSMCEEAFTLHCTVAFVL